MDLTPAAHASSPASLPGFDSIVAASQDVFDQTRPMYQHLVEVAEYMQQANMTIQTLSSLMSELKIDRSHSMIVSLMRMLTDYLKMHLILEKADERKAVVVLHLFAHQVGDIPRRALVKLLLPSSLAVCALQAGRNSSNMFWPPMTGDQEVDRAESGGGGAGTQEA